MQRISRVIVRKHQFGLINYVKSHFKVVGMSVLELLPIASASPSISVAIAQLQNTLLLLRTNLQQPPYSKRSSPVGS